jgi:hypothetical protein
MQIFQNKNNWKSNTFLVPSILDKGYQLVSDTLCKWYSLLTWLYYSRTGIEPRTSHMLGKSSTTWATPLALQETLEEEDEVACDLRNFLKTHLSQSQITLLAFIRVNNVLLKRTNCSVGIIKCLLFRICLKILTYESTNPKVLHHNLGQVPIRPHSRNTCLKSDPSKLWLSHLCLSISEMLLKR